ncbi:hypothetical protein ES703_80309 [subsurface metagenome]
MDIGLLADIICVGVVFIVELRIICTGIGGSDSAEIIVGGLIGNTWCRVAALSNSRADVFVGGNSS